MSEFPSFLRLNNISLYVYSTFAYPFNLLMDTSCLHILAVVNNTVKNMVYKYLFETAFNSFGYVYPEVKLLDHMVILILKIFWAMLFSTMTVLFYIHIRSMLFICSVVSNSLRPHGLQHARLPCPSQSPGVCSNSCLLSWLWHPTILSSVTLFSSCPHSFPASGSFPVSQLFISGGQTIGVSASASVFHMNIKGWFLLGFTGLIFWLSKGLLTVFSGTTVWKHQFFSAQPSF